MIWYGFAQSWGIYVLDIWLIENMENEVHFTENPVHYGMNMPGGSGLNQ